MANLKNIASAIALALVGVMVGYILFNSLFTPTNTAVTDLNTTLTDAGYTTEADLSVTAWEFVILAIPFLFLGGAIVMIVGAFRK